MLRPAPPPLRGAFPAHTRQRAWSLAARMRWWRGQRAHRPAAAARRDGLSLSGATVLIPRDHHAWLWWRPGWRLVVRGSRHLGARSALNFMRWGCSFQLSPPDLSPPAPWGALCDTGWLFPAACPGAGGGRWALTAQRWSAVGLMTPSQLDAREHRSPGLGWMGESMRWHREGSRPTATRDRDGSEPWGGSSRG